MTDTLPESPVREDDDLTDAALFTTLMLAAAAEENASPVVYFEPEDEQLVVYNLDDNGVKEYLSDAPGYMTERVAEYMRRFSNPLVDVETNLEKGRFSFKMGGLELNYQVAIKPTDDGEITILTYEA